MDIISFLKYALFITIFSTSKIGFARDLLVKITWTSSTIRTDFDMFIKSPDGKICNYGGEGGQKDQGEWGCIHIKDDWGKVNSRSFEAFKINLDKMDEYSTRKNLLNMGGNSDYKFYISRYAGQNVSVRFSYGDSSNCSENDANDCPNGLWSYNIDQTKIANAQFVVRYSPSYRKPTFSLETKKFSKIDVAAMRTRYLKSLQYYYTNQTELDERADSFINFINYTGQILDDNALGNVSAGFYLLGLTTASYTLDHFLNGSGTFLWIDIENALEDGGAKKFVYKKIVDSIELGISNGEVSIGQADWGSDPNTVGQDARYAYGTLRIQWESDGSDVVLFVDDIYSFDISDYTKTRQTIPLYKNAGDLVLAGIASDFYFNGRTRRISISSLKSYLKNN